MSVDVGIEEPWRCIIISQQKPRSGSLTVKMQMKGDDMESNKAFIDLNINQWREKGASLENASRVSTTA